MVLTSHFSYLFYVSQSSKTLTCFAVDGQMSTVRINIDISVLSIEQRDNQVLFKNLKSEVSYF